MESFTKDKVVPDVIDKVPPKLLKGPAMWNELLIEIRHKDRSISRVLSKLTFFGCKNKFKDLLHYGSIEVKAGMVLTPTQVKDRPKVEYEAEVGAYYTLIMNDPDAPSRKNPVKGEWHHWLVTNIPGADVSKGEENSQYVGSGPPKGTGLHRYVFLLFKQPKGKMTFAGLPKLSNHSGDGRANHKVKDFTKKHGLDGNLVAGNFYQAEYDDYVPKLYEQLSGK